MLAKGHIFAMKKSELVQIHCDLQDKNVRTLWPITCVTGQPLPKNGQKWPMAGFYFTHCNRYIHAGVVENY